MAYQRCGESLEIRHEAVALPGVIVDQEDLGTAFKWLGMYEVIDNADIQQYCKHNISYQHRIL